MLILVGETIFAQSINLLEYALGIFIAFNLFIIFREEPRLERDFGNAYVAYKKQVRRWI
jgi:protein-S-isoprenylcysteine O-methyltransferase Ste14